MTIHRFGGINDNLLFLAITETIDTSDDLTEESFFIFAMIISDCSAGGRNRQEEGEGDNHDFYEVGSQFDRSRDHKVDRSRDYKRCHYEVSLNTEGKKGSGKKFPRSLVCFVVHTTSSCCGLVSGIFFLGRLRFIYDGFRSHHFYR